MMGFEKDDRSFMQDLVFFLEGLNSKKWGGGGPLDPETKELLQGLSQADLVPLFLTSAICLLTPDLDVQDLWLCSDVSRFLHANRILPTTPHVGCGNSKQNLHRSFKKENSLHGMK